MEMIILTSNIPGRGGSERVILELAKYFDAPVYCADYDPENTFEEFQDLHVEVAKPGLWRKLLKNSHLYHLAVAKYFYNLKLDGYDIISSHIPSAEFASRKNRPHIWYSHGFRNTVFDTPDDNGPEPSIFAKVVSKTTNLPIRYLKQHNIKNIDHIFTCSKYVQGIVKSRLKAGAEVLYPGVDAKKFRCRDPEPFFFYPSRFSSVKRFEDAIQAFRIFSSRVPGFRLVLAGSTDGPDSHPYIERLKSLSNDSISIETNIDDERLCDLYSRCSAVLFPPHREDFGIVPLEAMASSKPCIARNECGPKESISDGKDGFLVKSVEEMAAKMELLAKDPELCAAMGKAGRKKVLRDFTWSRFLKRFEEKSNELVSSA